MNFKSNESNSIKPQYFRQRSSSCGSNWSPDLKDQNQEEIYLDIHLVRRRSLGHNIKLGINTPKVLNKELSNNGNELIISIPVLISDNNSINIKDFDEESCEKNTTYGEPTLQSSWTALKQMLIPFLIAGIGSVGAGIVLNNVQHWPAFEAIPQLIIMIPSFLGLIGNIETTLASRLSTHANLGTLDNFENMKSMIMGNAAVVECQASTVGLFAAIASLAMSYITGSHKDKATFNNILLLSASSVITSILANTLLATTISLVIVIARKVNINPDNIATPIAASMGDVCTITILALTSDFLYNSCKVWLPATALVGLLMLAPILGYIARKNKYTRSVILTGWTPILGAVILEQPGGIVMENAFDKYDVMSTFQPLVNGIGSNLVGIQTSRLSTFLHQTAAKGKLPKSNPRACIQPFAAFFGSDIHSRMARLLLSITIPTHFLYLTIIFFWQHNFEFTAAFLISYMIAVVIQIMLLLYLAYVSVLWAWKRRINPDNSAIPFTSALADVFGNCLMAAAFTFLDSVGDINAQVVKDSTIISNITTTTMLPINQCF